MPTPGTPARMEREGGQASGWGLLVLFPGFLAEVRGRAAFRNLMKASFSQGGLL